MSYKKNRALGALTRDRSKREKKLSRKWFGVLAAARHVRRKTKQNMQWPWLWRSGRRGAWVGKGSVWPLHVELAADPRPALISSPPARELCPSWGWCEEVSGPRHSGPEAGSPASRWYLHRWKVKLVKMLLRKKLVQMRFWKHWSCNMIWEKVASAADIVVVVFWRTHKMVFSVDFGNKINVLKQGQHKQAQHTHFQGYYLRK